jgi:hypothetical protein
VQRLSDGGHADRLRAAAVALGFKLSQPGFKLSQPALWPVDRFADIDEALMRIDSDVVQPFGELDARAGFVAPRVERAETQNRLAPTVTIVPDEGPTVGESDVVALRQAFERLGAPSKLLIQSWLAEAKAAGSPFGALHDFPTLRRFELGRATIKLAPSEPTAEIVDALLVLAVGEEPPQPASLGALVGSLTAQEAVEFARVVDAYAFGSLAVTSLEPLRFAVAVTG